MALPGFALACRTRPRWTASRWLWVLPLLWFSWQLASATHTVDARLTAFTLWHFAGCVLAYFLGALVVDSGRGLRLVLMGVLAAFAFCLVQAMDQRWFEFPREQQELVEGERSGWTNYTAKAVAELKEQSVIISTNGVDVANPIILKKYAKRRVHGTFVYPNALAGSVLLLWPAALAVVIASRRFLRPRVHAPAVALTVFLGGAALFYTGSKSGWLIALGMIAVFGFRLDWPRRIKWAVLALMLLGGLGVFAIRFHEYFAPGAASISARFDYWRAAARTTADHPMFGTGPGTFQRPYAQIKAPDAEMARLTHNDYLEQFSDSGFIGGISYLAWIVLMLAVIARRVRPRNRADPPDPLHFPIFLGLLGWFAQGVAEFELYVPALAWTAFLLAGILVRTVNERSGKILYAQVQ